MRCVLLGDVHLFRYRMSPRRLLLSKRALGVTNLVLTRRHRFRHDLLPGLVQQACDLQPEVALFSGDVTTTSLESEFRAFRQAVRPLTEAAGRSVFVPGNHDRYTFGSKRAGRVEAELKGLIPPRFPHHERLSDTWSVLALDPVIPQKLHARGRLGRDQFSSALNVIRQVPEDQGLLVLCHYPCVYPEGVLHAPSHDMAEDTPMREALLRCRGRVVYCHGHIHRPWALHRGDDPRVPFTCINAGSPCYTSKDYPAGQGFYSFTLPADPRGDLGIEHHVSAEASTVVAAEVG
ncbi:MAG: metallophosphoesterase [Planctomycetota bacterium]